MRFLQYGILLSFYVHMFHIFNICAFYVCFMFYLFFIRINYYHYSFMDCFRNSSWSVRFGRIYATSRNTSTFLFVLILTATGSKLGRSEKLHCSTTNVCCVTDKDPYSPMVISLEKGVQFLKFNVLFAGCHVSFRHNVSISYLFTIFSKWNRLAI